MKNKITKALPVAWIMLISIFIIKLSGCGSTPAPSAKEEVTKELTSGAWKMQNVSVDGTDKSSVYTGFTVTFSATGFTATNGEPVWPASGTWSFTDDTAKTFTRNDGLSISIEQVSTSQLVLKLTWSKTTIGPGRTNSVGGQNTFTFSH